MFVLIYLTCTLAYLRWAGLTVRTGLNALLVSVMAVTLIESGNRSLYGVVVAFGCVVWCYVRRRVRS